MATAKVLTPIEDIRITLKSLVRQINQGFAVMNNRFEKTDRQFGIVNHGIKNLNKRFDHQERQLFKWKSDIHTLIDKGFTRKAKDHDIEIGILNTRTVNLRSRVEKLEKSVYNQPSL